MPVRDCQPGRCMKKWSRIVLLLAVICLAGIARQSIAGTACILTLEWQGNPDSAVAGYALYYGETGDPLTNRMDVGLQTAAVVKDLAVFEEYTFYVVAYDIDQNESEPSDPLVYTIQAISSLGLSQSSDGSSMNISFRVAPNEDCWVEYTDSLTPPDWNLLTTATGDSNGDVVINDPTVQDSRFYRVGVQQISDSPSSDPPQSDPPPTDPPPSDPPPSDPPPSDPPPSDPPPSDPPPSDPPPSDPPPSDPPPSDPPPSDPPPSDPPPSDPPVDPTSGDPTSGDPPPMIHPVILHRATRRRVIRHRVILHRVIRLRAIRLRAIHQLIPPQVIQRTIHRVILQVIQRMTRPVTQRLTRLVTRQAILQVIQLVTRPVIQPATPLVTRQCPRISSAFPIPSRACRFASVSPRLCGSTRILRSRMRR